MCRILDSDLNLQTDGMLVSHLSREVESAVREILVPDHARKGSPQRPKTEGHRFEVKEILASLGIAEDDPARVTWFAEVDQQAKFAHRNNLQPRRLDDAMRERMDRIEAMLDTVLGAAEGRYLAFVDRLKALAAKPDPTLADAERLRTEYPQDLLTLEAFFSFLDSPAWLEPLRAAGFFAEPPEPEGQEGGGVSYSWWPASAYLARMASADPERVVDIAVGVPQTDNPRVKLDLVEIATRVPADTAVAMVPGLVAGLRGPYLILPDRYGDLAVRFAEYGLPEQALELMSALLEVGDQGGSQVDDWYYQRILERCGSALPQHVGISWLQLLAKTLDQALAALGKGKTSTGSDASGVWYPALEVDQPLAYPGPEIRLVAAIRDAADQLLRDGAAALTEVLAVLDARSWTIFRRLRLHLLEHHGGGTDRVTRALVDSDLIADEWVKREWLRLARTGCEALGEDDREILLAAIDAGPDTQQWIDNFERTYGEAIPPERLRAMADLWRRDRYAAVRGILDHERESGLDVLETAYGPAPSLDKPHQDITPVSPPPAVGVSELASLDTADLVARVQAWTPEYGPFGLSNLTDYAAVLRKTVADQALRHNAHADLFAVLEDVYLAQVLNGFKDAAKSVLVDWNALMGLLAVASERTGTPGAHELHYEAVDLVRSAITQETNPAPPKLAEAIWKVLVTVMRSPDVREPGPEPGLYWSDARAHALRAAVDWANWRHYLKAETEALFTLLDELLSDLPLPGAQGRQVLATVVGEQYPALTQLSPKWASDHAPLLHTDDPFGSTAWSAYLTGPFTVPSAVLLLDTYRAEALLDTDQEDDKTARLRLALGQRLVLLFWGGQVDLDGDAGILTAYYARTIASVRRQLAASVARFQFAEASAEVTERIQQWWDWRLAAASAADPGDREARKELLDAVSGITTSGGFPDEWCIAQLSAVLIVSGELRYDTTTFDYLTRVAAEHTGAVLGLLKELISSLDERSGLPSFRESEIRTLLRIGLRDPEHSEAAKMIINIAAARGHRQFAVLLDPPSPELDGRSSAARPD